MERPVPTFPEAEAAVVARAYAGAEVILEYGSGGSTILAAELGKTIFSVESDAVWLSRMQDWFDHHKQKGDVRLHLGHIGETRKWGMPKGNAGFAHFPGYALSVWDRPEFRHPDLVLIDGRFRPACLLATAFRISRPVRVLFDDYADRPEYHAIEEMFRPEMMHGRMAEFHLVPTQIPAERLLWIMGWFLKPR